MAEVKRSIRLAERVREELSTLIARRVKDPRAQDVVVTRVEMPDDLRLAKVWIRTLRGDEESGAEAVKALTGASGLLRKEMTRALALRFAPELRFVWDSGQDAATRVEQLLYEIEREKRKG
jgi:ribosome-binding factor A